MITWLSWSCVNVKLAGLIPANTCSPLEASMCKFLYAIDRAMTAKGLVLDFGS